MRVDLPDRRAPANSLRRVLPHDHALRNQSVGSMCSGQGSGPRLSMRMRIRISSGEAFAYSIVTSK